MLGIVLPWGAERSMMMRFLPEYFLVAIPRGLMRKLGNGGWMNDPIMKPSLTCGRLKIFYLEGDGWFTCFDVKFEIKLFKAK